MKKLLLLLALITLEQTRGSTYIFNFAAGPVSYWNTSTNWQGGMVPLTADSILLSAPVQGGNYTCIYDAAQVNILQYFLVGKGVTLVVLSDKTIDFSGKFILETNAAMDVTGTVRRRCPTYINNAGNIKIELAGSIRDEESFYCPEPSARSSFINSGELYNFGYLSFNTTNFNNNGLLLNAGSIDLVLKAQLHSTAIFINNGTITGNGVLEVTNLQNNGTIELSTAFFYTAFLSKGNLVNTGNIRNPGEYQFIGSVYNKGTIISTPASEQTYKSMAFDSAYIINDGIIDLSNNVPLRMSGSIINNKAISFFYEGSIGYSASLINNGNFYTSSAVLKGSVINNKDMTMETFFDSSRVKAPFINKGKLTTYGPIVLNDTFINSGELITQ